MTFTFRSFISPSMTESLVLTFSLRMSIVLLRSVVVEYLVVVKSTFGVLVEESLCRSDVGLKLFFCALYDMVEGSDTFMHLPNEILFHLKDIFLVLSL